jgi:hypothetical protein
MTHRYWHCGFVLASDWPLPEIGNIPSGNRCTGSGPLISIQLGETGIASPKTLEWFMRQDLPDGCPWSARARTDSGYLLRFYDLADFTVDFRGRSIRCVNRERGVADLTLRALLLDHVIPPVIALRGRYILHAAAVQTDSGACVFAGHSGAGKSTIAALLAKSGCGFITDDCLRIEDRDGVIEAWPSASCLKLRADAIALLSPQCAGQPVSEYTSKKRFHLSNFAGRSPARPVPAVRIYFLTREDGETPAVNAPVIQRLPAHIAFQKLIKHSIRLDSTDRALLEREFHFTRRIVDAVPAALFSLPDDLSSLRQVPDIIAADLASEARPAAHLPQQLSAAGTGGGS